MARLHGAVDAKPVRSRTRRSSRSCPCCTTSPTLTRNPASRNDPLFTGTDPVRRLSDEIALQQTFGDAGPRRRDYDGWEAGLVDLSRDRALANVKQGRGASYRRRCHPRARV